LKTSEEVDRAQRQCYTEAIRARAVVQAQHVTKPFVKMRIISRSTVYSVSEIKLIRTDTTLDLSQKAEKVYQNFLAEKDHTPEFRRALVGLFLFRRTPRYSRSCGATVRE
jgi:hypothetical protein